jgi:hypothetical protein
VKANKPSLITENGVLTGFQQGNFHALPGIATVPF